VELAAILVGAYFLGAIPFGVLVAKAHGVDIMRIGSGNIGATNVSRVLGRGPSLLVFALDVLKGLIPAIVARIVFPDRQELWMLAGALAIVGHSLSPFIRFKGGKGISTALGMCLGTTPILALCSFAVFIVVILIFRYMSVASLVGVGTTVPFALLFHCDPWVIGGYSTMTAFVIYRHRANIKRLIAGTEPTFTFKKTIDPKPEGDPPAPEEKEAKDEAPAGDHVAP